LEIGHWKFEHFDSGEIMAHCRKVLILAAAVVALFAANGCGLQNKMLGATGGVLLQGVDTLADPHSQAPVTARLQGGDYLRGLEGYLVGFYHLDRKIGESRTDQDGLAAIEYATGEVGNDIILAKLEDPDIRKYAIPAVEIVVAVRDKSSRMMVIDLDRTVVESGFSEVLANRAVPMADSQRVLSRAAKDYTIVYLTHRPDIFTERSKEWLRKYDYPVGPLLVSSLSGFLKSSQDFKNAAIKNLKDRYPNIEIGIGDQAGDAQAYLANGLKAIVIVHPELMKKPEDVRREIRDLQTLPAEVETVESWNQIDQVIFEGKHFPVAQALARLVKLHEQIMNQLLNASPSEPAPAKASEGGQK
jgi:hypothetical protein